MFNNIYQDKKVLITGHTGFKGSWLSAWLLKLGAKVVGYSKDIPTSPSMFEELGLNKKLKDYREDIGNLEMIMRVVRDEQPDFVFHLAAQPIVSTSYLNPVETLSTNVMGTTNLLEALRVTGVKCIAVMITSDKCYDNIEQVWGYKESDTVGGKDIYSGSKGAAELVIKSYFHSFFNSENNKVRLGIGRAGNVIGGGDWAKDRIVVDSMNSWMQNKAVEIRSPDATRPWQHVLEPLSGYLNLGQVLYQSGDLHGEAFNFGPRSVKNHTVVDLIKDLAKYSGMTDPSSAYEITAHKPFHEAGLLKLNCDKSMFYLNWEATLNYQQTVQFTGSWYSHFHKQGKNLFDVTVRQIEVYENQAKDQGIKWTE